MNIVERSCLKPANFRTPYFKDTKKMDEKESIIIEKASHYASKEIEVHLTLIDGTFYNGILIDVNDVRILIQDRKLDEVYVAIREVREVEPYEKKEGVGE